MDEKRILVTGIGGNVAQGVLRIIKNSFPDIYLVGCDINKLNPGSHLCNQSFKVPFSTNKNYIPEINRIISDLNISLVIPTTDLECLILSKNNIECPVLVSEYNLCKIFFDKFSTFKEFKRRISHLPTLFSQVNLNQNSKILSLSQEKEMALKES